MMTFRKIIGVFILFITASCFASEDVKKQATSVQDHLHDSNHHEPNHNHENVSTAHSVTKDDDSKIAKKAPSSNQEAEAQMSPSLMHDSSTNRQFTPLYQPMFPQPSGFNMIRRQFGGGMDLLGDIVMMGMIGLPILGLLTVGSSSIANFLGFGSSKSSSKRTKRSLKEKAAGAVEYAKNLWDVMEQLEKAFEKYDLYQAECRLRAVCEAHQKAPRLGAWGQTIIDLMRKQKELESREIVPVSRFLFSNYAEAAQVGSRGGDCGQFFEDCSLHANEIHK